MEASAAVILPGRRLGKLPPQFDPRTVRMATYLRPRALPPIPKSVDRMTRVLKAGGFPMLGNDRIGDCTCASIEHIDLADETYGRHVGLGSGDREAQTIALYSKVSGYDPVTGANDNGANLLDVLKAVSTTGYDGAGADKIGAYIAVDPQKEREMVAALYLFGVLYAGVNLPVSAQAEVGRTWATTTGPGSEPGSWGGHAIFIGRITSKKRTCVTWGQPQDMTPEWQRRYADEMWTFISPDFIRDHTKKTISGFDLPALMADIEALRTIAPLPRHAGP